MTPARTARRPQPWRRATAVAAFLVAALVAAPLTWLATLPAEAAPTATFSKRFAANTTGDVVVRGNTLMSCSATVPGCLQARAGEGTSLNNNDWSMRFVDVDDDPATRSSSSAALPLGEGAGVLWAGLYWSAYTSNGAAPPAGTAKGRLLLRVPGADGYRSVTADTIYDNDANHTYQSVADVTSLVREAGAGTYTAADIYAAANAVDRYAAWALVVAVRDPALPLRNLTVFDGFGTVQKTTAGERSLTIPVSGFETPRAGAVRTRLGAVVYEGDRGFVGDSFSLVRADGTAAPILDAANPATNIFNSTTRDGGLAVPGRDPGEDNTLGFDADVYDSELLPHGATSAALRLTTSGDTYFPGVLTFATDLYAPLLVAEKAATPVDADGDGVLGEGDRIRYTVDVTDRGLDDATDAVLTDAVPLGTRYDAGSLRVDDVSVTDAVDGDRADTDGSTVTVRLGAGAGGGGSAGGGTLRIGDSTRISFEAVITSRNPEGADVLNVADVSYRAPASGLLLSGSSNPVTTPVTARRADLGVRLTATPSLLQRDGDRQVTWTATVVDNGPQAERAPMLVLELPAGVGDVEAPDCVRAVRLISCRLGPLAAGATTTVSVHGSLPPDAEDPSPASARVSGDEIDPVPDNDTDTATVAVNTPPHARADAATAEPGTAAVVDVLDNDSDADSDPLSVVTAVLRQPLHGALTLDGDRLVWTPTDPSFAGTDAAVYRVCDDRRGCDEATVTITVPDAPPVARDDAAGTATGTPVDVAFLGNDTDANGDALTVTGTGRATHGTVTVDADGGGVRYRPDAGFAGEDRFDYTVCDDADPPRCDTATVTVHVDDAAPVAVDDAVDGRFGSPVRIHTDALLRNDSDPNEDPLTIVSVADPEAGSVVFDAATGDVVFTPAAGFVGQASFRYEISDGTLRAQARVVVTVPGTAPVARGDVAEVHAGAERAIAVKENDSDAESPASDLTVTLLDDPERGAAFVDADGRVVVTAPDDGFRGEYTLRYQLCDPQGSCDTASVVVTVPDQAPVAVADQRSVAAGSSVDIAVLDNDTDRNGDPLEVTGLAARPSFGTAVVTPTGITYVPDDGFRGQDTFEYRVCDDAVPARCDTAVVTVDVANRPPLADPDSLAVPHVAGHATVVTVPVTDDDADPDGDPLEVTDVTTPAEGVATWHDGVVVVTTPAGFVGTQTLTYEVSDGHGGAARATVSVTVTNGLPTGVADAARTTGGTPVSIPVLANDVDPDGDALTLDEITAPPAHGTAARDGDALTYQPEDGWAGTDTVGYRACDPYGACTDAVVTVVVAAAPGGGGPTPTSPDPSTSSPDPTTSSPDPTTSSPDPTTSSPDPSTSSPDPSTSNPDPSPPTPTPTVTPPGPHASAPEDPAPTVTVSRRVIHRTPDRPRTGAPPVGVGPTGDPTSSRRPSTTRRVAALPPVERTPAAAPAPRGRPGDPGVSARLPFTGFDARGWLAGGLVLLLAGTALLRPGRSPAPGTAVGDRLGEAPGDGLGDGPGAPGTTP